MSTIFRKNFNNIYILFIKNFLHLPLPPILYCVHTIFFSNGGNVLFSIYFIFTAFTLFSLLGASFPEKLPPAEEKLLLEKFLSGDLDAKNKLIEHNLRLVAHICKKYASFGKDTEDLISIGTIGLIKALSSFNPEKGTRLATYAARCIENAILSHSLYCLFI